MGAKSNQRRKCLKFKNEDILQDAGKIRGKMAFNIVRV